MTKQQKQNEPAELLNENSTELNYIPSEPILKYVDDDAGVAVITFIDGRDYRLQHPGNRKSLQWRQATISLTEGLKQDDLLDKFFRYCVTPERHAFKPTLDTVKTNHVEVWLRVANRFLKGELEQ